MGNKKEMFLQNLKNHNHALNELQIKQFETYAQILIEWNQKMNLTAIDDEDGIYEKHFLDSILMSYDIDIKGCLCDVGSGAGFPSIPLKIVYPQLKVWIVEPLQKRCIFLRELVSVLGLQDVEIINARAEDYGKEKREFFDIVSARAVANLTMLSELCIPFVKLGGIFVAMKGPQGEEEYLEAKQAIKKLGCDLEESYHSNLEDMMRINLVFKKVTKTPMKYPRAFAQIKKSPLK